MDKHVKVFFSQPMHGLTDEEIISERVLMMDEFRNFLCHELGFDSDVEILDVNNTFNEPGPIYVGRLWYLGRSIQNLDGADYIVFNNFFATRSFRKTTCGKSWCDILQQESYDSLCETPNFILFLSTLCCFR